MQFVSFLLVMGVVVLGTYSVAANLHHIANQKLKPKKCPVPVKKSRN